MNYAQVVNYYGGLSKAARELGIAKQTIHGWGKGRIPSEWQAELEARTAGKLSADKQTLQDASVFTRLLSLRKAA